MYTCSQQISTSEIIVGVYIISKCFGDITVQSVTKAGSNSM